ncbi:hypothetical protein QBC38DRAFT_463483 [Podospora fimiseda]|uniref:SH3 domain-containing protein n=1 Tax=Podospora fimiseda TaxID=252190 RepID=A0AAN7BYZ0_9PEZI|nr:hypothetical protein QBC38DRAFT_463483 [Podospora fimiseda]
MVSADRQQVIETNRSLRLIKNELESLLEKGVITDDAFDTITTLLPAEAPLSAAATRATNNQSLPTPASIPAASNNPTPPTSTLNNLSLNSSSSHPPSYSQTTAVPPSLPNRNPAPSTVPTKPILAHARAVYKYAATDARDCSFERDDRIAVYEYMNADWWMGRNTRTGQEGIFPKSYVTIENDNEKAAAPQVLYPQQPAYNQGYPAAPPQGEPYNAQQPQGEEGKDSKIGEHGKKFGKKLGNAAIFGAGATIGSNIVNSIF